MSAPVVRVVVDEDTGFVMITGALEEEFDPDAEDVPRGGVLAFSDGTRLIVTYSPFAEAWRIIPRTRGTGRLVITQAFGDEYSDVAVLHGSPASVTFGAAGVT